MGGIPDNVSCRKVVHHLLTSVTVTCMDFQEWLLLSRRRGCDIHLSKHQRYRVYPTLPDLPFKPSQDRFRDTYFQGRVGDGKSLLPVPGDFLKRLTCQSMMQKSDAKGNVSKALLNFKSIVYRGISKSTASAHHRESIKTHAHRPHNPSGVIKTTVIYHAPWPRVQ